ncbi:hypothetical protein LguiA_006452 [Lonicera macranthoides]
MAPKKQLRQLLHIFKDKASLIRATVSTKRATSSIRVAVLRCTTHSSSSLPQDHRIATVLTLGNGSRPTACTCIETIMDRLHKSHNAYVALKCLLTLHNIISKGSFILKDQVSFYPCSGGRNFLNLSRFFDKSDAETWEFSSWVRWYASVLECNLTTSRIIGSYFSFPSSKKIDIDKVAENLTLLLNSDLLREIDALVNFVEDICKAPESLHFQRNNLVYEVVRMVSEDYRLTQHHMMIRLGQLADRTDGLSRDELDELTRCLERLEECRERLTLLFVNRKRNDAFWELVSETKGGVLRKIEERERAMVKLEIEPTRFGKRVVGPGQMLMLLPCPVIG